MSLLTESTQLTGTSPFVIGALYNRQVDLHQRFGGQQQSGISTPAEAPYVFIFTGDAGKEHGYLDFWDDYGLFHYFGEGQSGDMRMTGGNLAILEHIKRNKHLLLFQMMGKGKPCRFLGEHTCVGFYERPGVPDSSGSTRTAIVFTLRPLEPDDHEQVSELLAGLDLDSTTVTRTMEVRRKQDLFRKRLITIEKECRLTGVRDLRFVRASHMKPWSACVSGDERIDGYNGLLLTPTADHLFDRGWISFEDTGRLLVARDLRDDVVQRISLDLRAGRACGKFKQKQLTYLEYHRSQVFERQYVRARDPYKELLSAIAADTTAGD